MPVLKKLERYKGNTMKLTFSEGEPRFLNCETVSRFELMQGMNIPESAWEEIESAESRRKAKERALYLLDYKDYSYAELVKKLMNNYDEDTCFEVADGLAERGLINDRRYAESIARRYFEGKLSGEYKVRLKLREKGVPGSVTEAVIAPYRENAAQRAAELAQKKYMRYCDTEDRILMQKLRNALASQGYSYREISGAIEILKELSDDE